VLVTDAAAAASVIELVGDQALFVPILVVLSANDLPARRRLALEAGNGGSHRSPPCRLGRGRSRATAPRAISRVSVPALDPDSTLVDGWRQRVFSTGACQEGHTPSAFAAFS